jgi:hypothetical protein
MINASIECLLKYVEINAIMREGIYTVPNRIVNNGVWEYTIARKIKNNHSSILIQMLKGFSSQVCPIG